LTDAHRGVEIDAWKIAGAGPNGEATRRVAGALVALSKDLELPEGFLTALLLEHSDWAFIVKAQAILETAVTSLLVAHLGKPELEDFIAEEMEMSQRIKMLSALDLCTPAQREMMRRLGNLRNRLAHTATGTLFSLSGYLKDKSARVNFWKAFGINWAATPDAKIKAIEAGLPEFVPLAPRLAIWGDVVSVVIETATTTERRRLEAMQADMDREALLGLMRAAEEQAETPPDPAA
jgi:hypothetical protein